MATTLPVRPFSPPRFAWPLIARDCAFLISKHGQDCILRRASGDRWVRAFIRRITARDMMGGLTDPLMRFAIVAAPVDPPPDHQQDRLVTFEQPIGVVPIELETLRLMANPEKIAPSGIVAFWKLALRR